MPVRCGSLSLLGLASTTALWALLVWWRCGVPSHEAGQRVDAVPGMALTTVLGPAAAPAAAAESTTASEALQAKRRPLHVFRLQGIDYLALEFLSWLSYIENIGRPLIIHEPKDPICSDALVMGEDPAPALAQITKRKLTNVGFFQYADERGFKTAYKHYADPRLSYILRNYYLPQYFTHREYKDKLVFIPTGSHNLIRPVPWEALPPASARSIQCNFFGSISSSNTALRNVARRHLMDSLKKQGDPCKAKLQGQFGGDVRPLDFAFMLRNSVFTLCPRGHNEETIRLYDAMASGSIPVVLRGYVFMHSQDNWIHHPFVVLDSWDQLTERMAQLTADKVELDARQRRVVQFYQQLRANTSRAIKEHVDASFQAAYGTEA